MMEGHFTPVLASLFRWDEMSVGTCPAYIPWNSTWSDVVSSLRAKGIDRVLAWGDSSADGQCRFESAADGISIAGKSSDTLAHRLLALFSSIAETMAEEHSQFYSGEEAFFSSGRKRFDFNACIDLRDGTDIRVNVHVSAACGLVYMLNVWPYSAARTTPQIACEEGDVRA